MQIGINCLSIVGYIEKKNGKEKRRSNAAPNPIGENVNTIYHTRKIKGCMTDFSPAFLFFFSILMDKDLQIYDK